MFSKPARNAITFIHYDLGFSTMRPADCGGLCFDRHKVNLNQAPAGHQVGVRQVTDRIWLVSFMDYDLGYFDDERRWRVREPIDHGLSRASRRFLCRRCGDR